MEPGPPKPQDGERLDPSAFEARQSTLADLWRFLAERRKLWLVPLLVILLVLALVLTIGATVLGPFIYTLF